MVAMKSNSEALKLMKKAKSNYNFGLILGGLGGGLIGYPIGTSLGGGDPNWTLAGVGAALVIISIPINTSINKNTQQAIELYNSSLDTTSFYNFKPEFTIIGNTNGIGISMSF